MSILPLSFLGRYPHLLKDLPLGLMGCDEHKASRGLLLRLWDILETITPQLTQKQDNQRKVQEPSYYIFRKLRAIPNNKVRLVAVASALLRDLH